MTAHPFVHMEISAKDPAAASKFYSELFGWKIEEDPQFHYHQWGAEAGVGGGFVNVGSQGGISYEAGDIVPYLGTDDIDAKLKEIEAKGGKMVLPKTEIPGIGWFAFFTDPSGNRLGLYTSAHPH